MNLKPNTHVIVAKDDATRMRVEAYLRNQGSPFVHEEPTRMADLAEKVVATAGYPLELLAFTEAVLELPSDPGVDSSEASYYEVDVQTGNPDDARAQIQAVVGTDARCRELMRELQLDTRPRHHVAWWLRRRRSRIATFPPDTRDFDGLNVMGEVATCGAASTAGIVAIPMPTGFLTVSVTRCSG